MKLYLVNLGGTRRGCITECHEIRALLAEDLDCALKVAAAATDLSALHLDGYAEIQLTEASAVSEQQLYFMELGKGGHGMDEAHIFAFAWATTPAAAGQRFRAQHKGWHLDTVFNLSRVAADAGYAIPYEAEETSPYLPQQLSTYRKLTKRAR